MNTICKKTGIGAPSKCACIPVLVIFAPTACGKTSFAQKLFSKASISSLAGKAEIISADSMQVYCGMDIGTATPSLKELEDLPHHLINVYSPKEQFGAGEFVRNAIKACQDIFERGKIPVLMGGTAFYIKSFLYGLPPTPSADEKVRKEIAQRMIDEGAKVLWDELFTLDSESAKKIHVNDEYRIKRALEVVVSSGKPRSSFQLSQEKRSGFDFYVASLSRQRSELYARINKRVDLMFDSGLVDEMRSLVENGFVKEDPGMQAIGYREFFMAAEKAGIANVKDVFNQEEVLSLTKEMIKTDTRRYAKRQEVFFKSLRGVERFSIEEEATLQINIIDFFVKHGIIP